MIRVQVIFGVLLQRTLARRDTVQVPVLGSEVTRSLLVLSVQLSMRGIASSSSSSSMREEAWLGVPRSLRTINIVGQVLDQSV